MNIKVRATAAGIYDHTAYKPGDVFEVDEKFFNDMNHTGEHIDLQHARKFQWLEKVDIAKDKAAYEKLRDAEKKQAEKEAKEKEDFEKKKFEPPVQPAPKAKLEAEQPGHPMLAQYANETDEQYQARLNAQAEIDRQHQNRMQNPPAVPTTHVETKDEREKREWLENERKAKENESVGQADQHSAERKGWA